MFIYLQIKKIYKLYEAEECYNLLFSIKLFSYTAFNVNIHIFIVCCFLFSIVNIVNFLNHFMKITTHRTMPLCVNK